jgi:hypothetical protein
MEIAENITLAIAIFLVLWQILSLRNAVVNGGSIFPAMIPSLMFFTISIAVVLALHISAFHLVWLFLVCFILGIVAIVSPQVQALSMNLVALLAMTGTHGEDEKERNSDLPVFTNPKKMKEKARGFGE